MGLASGTNINPVNPDSYRILGDLSFFKHRPAYKPLDEEPLIVENSIDTIRRVVLD